MSRQRISQQDRKFCPPFCPPDRISNRLGSNPDLPIMPPLQPTIPCLHPTHLPTMPHPRPRIHHAPTHLQHSTTCLSSIIPSILMILSYLASLVSWRVTHLLNKSISARFKIESWIIWGAGSVSCLTGLYILLIASSSAHSVIHHVEDNLWWLMAPTAVYACNTPRQIETSYRAISAPAPQKTANFKICFHCLFIAFVVMFHLYVTLKINFKYTCPPRKATSPGKRFRPPAVPLFPVFSFILKIFL